MKKIIPAVVVAFALAGMARAAEIQKDIQYGAPNGTPILLDARIPDGPGPFPALVIVHGGGWGGGRKDDAREVVPILDPLTEGKIAWFSINYRLSGQAYYPACVEDSEAAVQFVKAHAKEYRIDPNKVGISGDSAGGHIVDMVAVRATADKPERHLAAVISFYGPNDLVEDSFRRNTPSPSLQRLFGIPPNILDTPTVQLLQNASPTAYISTDLPPFLLVHGTADESVDYPGSIRWKAALDAIGVPCELITVPNGKHVMGTWDAMTPPQTWYKAPVVKWLQDTFAKADAKPRAKKTAMVTKQKVSGLWKNTEGPDNSGLYLIPDGSGDSIVAPASTIKWMFDPEVNLVHIDYPLGKGRVVPFATSPALSPEERDKISPPLSEPPKAASADQAAPARSFAGAAGPRPTVGFADLRYFPAQDLMISSNGEIFKRQPKAAEVAWLAVKATLPPPPAPPPAAGGGRGGRGGGRGGRGGANAAGTPGTAPAADPASVLPPAKM